MLAAVVAAIALLGLLTGVAQAERGSGPPDRTASPSISGAAIEAGRLKATRGTWTGRSPFSFSQSWSRCTSTGTECQPIAGATKLSYRPGAADVGHRLTITEIAMNDEGTSEASSTPSALVGPAAPKRHTAPTVTGSAIDGRLLTVGEGVWKGTPPFTFTYRWERCKGRSCEIIPGATEAAYRAQTVDIGLKLRALVTAHNAAGEATAKSKPTAKVAPGSPVNLAAPSISGLVVPGQTLTANDGTWVGTPPITYSYQWLGCAPLGGGCTEIAGATEPTHTVGLGEVGEAFEVTVTATNAEGSASATSPETTAVSGGSQPPENLIAPSVLGLALTGQTLTADEGVWTGTGPIAYAFQWELCDSAGSSCATISGARESTYKIPDGDTGHTLRVEVTASNVLTSVEKTSAVTSEVLGVGPENAELPSISGTPTAGQTLTASPGKWSGTEPILYEYEWLRCNMVGGECTTASAASLLPTYTAAGADVGHTLRVKVIAKNVAGNGAAESAATATVAGVAPENVIAPLVLGLDITGQTLTATEGTWSGTEPISYSFRWELCNGAGASCATISGATKSTFVIPDGDAGHTLRVDVTAKNVAGSVERESSVTAEVLGVGPENNELPSIAGTATAGQTLTASAGKWTGTEPILYEYEWLRCNTAGSECTTASAASLLPTYTASGADVGHKLRVEVIAKNIAGSGTAESAATATVAGVAPENVIAPAVLGLDVTGQTLTATEGTWTGTEPISYSFQWELCNTAGASCVSISGATKSSFVIPDGDAGQTLRVTVKATNLVTSVEKASAVTGEVLGVAPKNTELPSISGTPTAGQTLTAASGKWSGTEPILYEYEWLRCNTAGESCVSAAGASILPTYTVPAADVGHELRVKVIAKNIAGGGAAESAATSTVAGVAPENLIAPAVVGLDVTGQTLTATEGTWTGTEPISYAFQWELCNTAGASCASISGATKSSFVIPDGDAGHTLRVDVTAKNVAGAVEKESFVTGEVLGVAPKNTELPVISGTPTAGQTLTASSGKWSGTEPIVYEYEWLRCNSAGESCVSAAGASILPTYTAAPADVGHRLRVKVIARNIAGSGAAESAATSTVAGVAPENVIAPAVVGLDVTGQTLTATEGTWTGTEPIAYSFQWEVCSSTGASCATISGATKSSFVIPDGDAGHTLRVTVKATNVVTSVEKASAVTGEVLGVAPKDTELPSVSGTPTAGQTLTAASGKWSGTEPILYDYEWLRCNSSGGQCATASAASLLTTYTVAAADVGHRLRVKVIAKNLAGSGTAESAATAEVAGVTPKNVVLPLIVGAPVSGTPSTASEGTWTGTEPITYSFQWLHCNAKGEACSEIGGATKNTYTPAAGEVGKALRVKVTAKNVAGSVAVESAATIPIVL